MAAVVRAAVAPTVVRTRVGAAPVRPAVLVVRRALLERRGPQDRQARLGWGEYRAPPARLGWRVPLGQQELPARQDRPGALGPPAQQGPPVPEWLGQAGLAVRQAPPAARAGNRSGATVFENLGDPPDRPR